MIEIEALFGEHEMEKINYHKNMSVTEYIIDMYIVDSMIVVSSRWTVKPVIIRISWQFINKLLTFMRNDIITN